jgi:hypothetical protein
VYVNIPNAFAIFTVIVSNIPLFTDRIAIQFKLLFLFIYLVNVQGAVFMAVKPYSLVAEYERV